jgi:exodeoxyribonuclease V alpha subunit
MREAIDAALEAAHDQAHIDLALSIDERSGSVHRLLRIRPDNSRSEASVASDLVIVDEASMLEFGLLEQLLRSCERAHVVLVGDPDQLASVNVGAALRDILESSNETMLSDRITRLTTNFRSESELVALAASINAGSSEDFKNVQTQFPDAIRRVTRHVDLLGEVCDEARELLEAARHDEQQALLLLRERTMLCATRRGVGSIQWWRTRIARELRRYGWNDDGAQRFAVGTPLLITRNESSLADTNATLFNGDVGVVSEGAEGPHVIFGPSQRPRTRTIESLDQAEPAWSLTIHKSQGSEYDNVVISLPDYDSPLMTRELLYTAVTRAKKRVTIIGSDQLLERALQRRISRVSSLPERVRALNARVLASSASNRG